MSSLNQVNIIGRVGKDPEIRYMDSGDAVTTVSVATSEKWKDKNTGEQKELTEWHRVNLFGKQAELAGEYLHTGDLVFFSGALRTRKWTDKEGVERFSTEIKADNMRFLSKKSDGGQGNSQGGRGAPRGRGDDQGGHQDAPRQASRPAPQRNEGRGQPARNAAPRAGGGGFEDFDDDIPF